MIHPPTLAARVAACFDQMIEFAGDGQSVAVLNPRSGAPANEAVNDTPPLQKA
jgi:hypothetical protein